MNSHQRLAEIHIAQARLRALRIFSFASAVFPGEWQPTLVEIFVPDLVEFGFHARKVNEFCGFMDDEFPPIDQMIVQISQGDPGNWEHNYRHALNALMHMTSFTVGHVHADHRQIFKNASSNLMVTYIKVATDKYPEVTVSVVGLVNCFLAEVIPRVKNKFPNFSF